MKQIDRIQIDARKKLLIKQLNIRGAPKQAFSIPPFNLNETVTSFVSEVSGLKPKRIKKLDQLNQLQRILENPFYGPYTYCISGKPNDMRAKLLAISIMAKAFEVQHISKLRKLKDKNLPLWHVVTGGFSNPLVDKYTETTKPSLLIVSNIPTNSTQVKVEKLRDLLETYSDIPKIVVTTGEDPLTFFNTKLFLPLNACILLNNTSVKRVLEI